MKGLGRGEERARDKEKRTSAEHFATAAAKVSIGRVRPGIIAEEFSRGQLGAGWDELGWDKRGNWNVSDRNNTLLFLRCCALQ